MKPSESRFLGKQFSVRGATALLAVSALLSNVLGLVRNVVFYHTVAPGQLDIYFASFRLPDFIFNVLILGAISSAFIPVISELRKDADDAAVWHVSDQVISWITLCFVGVAVILFVAMPWVMRLVVAGFDPARFAESVTISRILLVQSIFFAWSWSFGGILNSFKRFGTYAIAPLLYNITLIVGGLLAKPYGIHAIAWSVVIGAMLHMGVQYLEVRKIGYHPRINFTWSKQVKEVLTLMIPRSLSQGIAQLELIILTALGSGLMAGSIAIFSGMNDLQTTPTVVIANSLAVAFFPTLTALAVREQWGEIHGLLNKVIRTALFLLLPSITLCYVFNRPLITLYTNGHLTNLAIATFAWFLAGVIPTALVVILARVFYSVKDTKTPLFLNIIGAIAGTGAAVIGIKVYHGQVPVLALGNSVEDWTQCLLYLFFLYRLQPTLLPWKDIRLPLVGYLIGSGLMALIGWLVLHGIGSIGSLHATQAELTELIIGGLAAVLTYYLYSRVVHNEELQWLNRNVFTKRP